MSYKVFIFDLDGTLIDTSAGVIGALRDAEAKMGLSPAPDSITHRFIGPPIIDGFKMLHPELPDEVMPEMLRVYREAYAGGQMYNAEVYPCLRESVEAINAAGASSAVATAKVDYIAKQVLEHFGLYERFACVTAVTDAMHDKAVLLRRVLEATGCRGNEAVLIGDSQYDGDAANRAGVDFLAAMYGFGFDSEADAAPYKPAAYAQTPRELYELVCGYLK